MYYYGSRTTTTIPENDIGIKYFSSSKTLSFIADQQDNPADYKYKIVKKFTSSNFKLAYEMLLHNKFNVSKHPAFYNKANQTSTKFTTEGVALSVEHKKAISIALRGRKQTEEHIAKVKQTRQANFEVYNKYDCLIYSGLSSKDVQKLCRSLYSKTSSNRLGATKESKDQLKVQGKLHMVGWYTFKKGNKK